MIEIRNDDKVIQIGSDYKNLVLTRKLRVYDLPLKLKEFVYEDVRKYPDYKSRPQWDIGYDRMFEQGILKLKDFDNGSDPSIVSELTTRMLTLENNELFISIGGIDLERYYKEFMRTGEFAYDWGESWREEKRCKYFRTTNDFTYLTPKRDTEKRQYKFSYLTHEHGDRIHNYDLWIYVWGFLPATCGNYFSIFDEKGGCIFSDAQRPLKIIKALTESRDTWDDTVDITEQLLLRERYTPPENKAISIAALNFSYKALWDGGGLTYGNDASETDIDYLFSPEDNGGRVAYYLTGLSWFCQDDNHKTNKFSQVLFIDVTGY